MAKIKDWLLGKYELLNMIVLTLLLVGCCFHVCFIVLSLVWVILVCALNQNETQIFGILIYIRLFRYALEFNGIDFRQILTYILLAIMIKNLVLDFIHKKIRCKISVIIALVVFALYAFCLPASVHKTTVIDALDVAVMLFLVFVAYSKKQEIDFFKIIKYLAYAVALSAVFSYLNEIFDCTIYKSFRTEGKFTGFLYHANHFIAFANLALAGLLVSKLKEKIFTPEFVLLFTTIFVFAIKGTTRMFILSFIIYFALFAVLYLKKNGTRALKFLVLFASVLVSSLLLVQPEVVAVIYRVKNPYEFSLKDKLNTLSPEELRQILNGEVFFDPGRLGIWKLYFMQIFASVKSFLFGYGVSAPNIGMMHSHNEYIYFMYRYGLVGYIMLGVIIFLLVGKAEFKNWKKYIDFSLIILAHAVLILLEVNTLGFVPVVLFVLCLGAKKEDTSFAGEIERIEMQEMLLSHKPKNKLLKLWI